MNHIAIILFQDFIDAAIIKTMNTACEYCDLTTHHLNENSVITVSSSALYYTSELVYSSSSGNTTASTVITLTQNWLTQQHNNNIVVHINGTELVLSKQCMLHANECTRASCLRYLASNISCSTVSLSVCLSFKQTPLHIH